MKLMKLKKLLIVYISLLYLDVIFNLFTYEMYLRGTIFNILFFDLIQAGIITIIISLFIKYFVNN